MFMMRSHADARARSKVRDKFTREAGASLDSVISEEEKPPALIACLLLQLRL
jgi:hypothetical protein